MNLAELCDALAREARSASRIALYLDFDGTLSPIVTRHEDARLPTGVRDTLALLARDPRFVLAIVSGRAVSDLRRRVDIPNIIYAGNHGLEIEGCGLSFRAREAADCEAHLAQIVSQLQIELKPIPGAEVETKGLTASVHFRRVPAPQQREVAAILKNLVTHDDPQLILRDAKMVIEIRPRVRWNKGEGVLWIRGQLALENVLEIYIGDDTTDEDAFQLLPEAFTVHVGAGPTAARYRVAGPDEVALLLRSLIRDAG